MIPRVNLSIHHKQTRGSPWRRATGPKSWLSEVAYSIIGSIPIGATLWSMCIFANFSLATLKKSTSHWQKHLWCHKVLDGIMKYDIETR